MSRAPLSLMGVVAASAVAGLVFGAAPVASTWVHAGADDDAMGPAVRARGLAAAAAWTDTLHGGIAAPAPDGSDHLVVILDGPPASRSAPADRRARSAEILAQQAEVERRVTELGGTVTARWSIVLNGMAVSIPQGRGDAVAALDGVRTAFPATYLSPAASSIGQAAPVPAPAPDPQPAQAAPAHIALIDTAVDPTAPQLGGGIGPTFPIIGGDDLVDGDSDPTGGPQGPAWEGHGTQMAGTVIGSPSLDGLPPQSFPRLLAYRVVKEETVGAGSVPLARSDRVISAVEKAMDPNADGDTSDGADVILVGVASAYAGGGRDPVADALGAAVAMGAVVVAPAGNDGPTFSRVGSLGGPAQGEGVIAVGGMGETRAPRTASLSLAVGPASATLHDLPLLGPDPGVISDAPVVILPGSDGVGTGAVDADYQAAAAAGRNPAGAIVVVSRGGGSLSAKAAAASRAGVAALVVWDRGGTGMFPSGASEPLAVPTVGVGPDQGTALLRLIARQPGATGAVGLEARAPAEADVASFSSTGPTADGRIKPDLIAPAVQVDAPWHRGPDGSARTAPMTGTSIAAAQVAGMALRLRVDRPGLAPAAVRAALMNGARPLPDARMVAQGSGVAGVPVVPPVLIEPLGVTAPAASAPTRVSVRVRDISGAPGRYTPSVVRADGEAVWSGAPIDVAASRGEDVTVALPAAPRGWTGYLVLRAGVTGPIVARVPAATFPAVRAEDDLGTPVVSVQSGATQAEVRIGRMRDADGRIVNSPLHDVRVQLVPGDGSRPLVLAGFAGQGDWPAGVYRFVVSRRLPTGGEVPAGRYRLRVVGRSVTGAPRSAQSGEFALN